MNNNKREYGQESHKLKPLGITSRIVATSRLPFEDRQQKRARRE